MLMLSKESLILARKCMFVGFLKGVKRYKLWYPDGASSKSFISHDVTFKEDWMYMEKLVELVKRLLKIRFGYMFF